MCFCVPGFASSLSCLTISRSFSFIVESLGGVVSWHGRRDKAGNPIESTGVYRVNRNLALSRSMGDRYMRPYVTSEPDFVSVDITPEDEFIVGRYLGSVMCVIFCSWSVLCCKWICSLPSSRVLIATHSTFFCFNNVCWRFKLPRMDFGM